MEFLFALGLVLLVGLGLTIIVWLHKNYQRLEMVMVVLKEHGGKLKALETKLDGEPQKPEALKDFTDIVSVKPAVAPVIAPVPALAPEAVPMPETGSPPVAAKSENPVIDWPGAPSGPVPTPREPSEFERRTVEILRKMWSWLTVGEEYRNPAMTREYQAATTWLLRCSILLIVIGVGYFIKYSHDNSLFPPELRLSVAALFALGLLGGGCLLLKGKYKFFGITMIGGGFAGLYLVVYASVSLYHLLTAPVGLGVLVLLTAGGCLMALKLDQMLLAVLAIAGGYLAPVLLSTGSHNLTGLYTYMLVLTLGALALARYRNWRILNLLTFVLTWAIFFAAAPFQSKEDLLLSLGFAGAFFLAFSLLSLFFNVVNQVAITLIELFFQILNTLIFLGGTIPTVWDEYGKEQAGGLALAVAFYYSLQLAYLLWKKSKDRNLLLMQGVFATSLLALALPLMLVRDAITIAWSIQAAAMLYLGCRSRSVFVVKLGFVIFALAAGRLLWINFPECYGPGAVADFGVRLINFGGLIAALLAGYWVLHRYGEETVAVRGWLTPAEPPALKAVFFVALLIVAVAGFGEFVRLDRGYSKDWAQVGIVCWSALLLLLLTFLRGRYQDRWISLVAQVGMAALTVYSFITIIGNAGSGYDPAWGLIHLGSFVVMLAIVILGGRVLGYYGGEPKAMYLFLALAEVIWFFYTTMELNHLMRFYCPGGAKIAVSLLWGAHALMLVALGVLYSWRKARLIGLLLLTIAMFKVFLVDLSHAPTIYRVAGCMVLGIIMMAGAWFYTRFQSRLDHEA